jgi:hypothetical protein
MESSYRHITVERAGDVFCVRLARPRLDETAVLELADEWNALIDREGCRKLVLSLGPEDPECLYSVFLAKLVSLQRRLQEKGGALKLAEAGPHTLNIFEACRLKTFFDFIPDRAGAIEALSS